MNAAVSNAPQPQIIVVGGRKSGAVAAFLNLLLPGLGYMYCGRVLLGMFVFVVTLVLIAGTAGVGALIIYPVLVLDGFLAANRANRQMIVVR